MSTGHEKEAQEAQEKLLTEKGPFLFGGNFLPHSFTGVYKFINDTLKRDTLWTRDMVVEIDQLSRKIPELEPGEAYEVKDLHGKTRTLHVPDYDPKTDFLLIEIVGHQALAQMLDQDGNFKRTANDYRYVPFFIRKQTNEFHVSQQICFPNKDNWAKPESPWSLWKKEWDEPRWAKRSQQLRDLVKKRWSILRSVDQIVCFALGYLETGIPVKGTTIKIPRPKRFVQHMAVDTIRRTLEELSANESNEANAPIRSIPVFAQDPAYCDNCISVLKKELNIEATRHCDGFLKLRENTLVVCIAPGTAVRGVVFDITRALNGPLAVLCDEIEMNPTRWDGKGPGPEWLRWDEWDGATPSEDNEKSIPNDFTTNTMAEYCKKCSSDEFGDYKELTGISYKDAKSKYSDWPLTQVELKERLDLLSGDKVRYKEEYKCDYETHLNFVKAPEPMFGDLILYAKQA
jgi:hypothetical protein